MGVRRLHIHSDSQFIVKQVTSDYQTKDEKMQSYLPKVKKVTWKVRRMKNVSNPLNRECGGRRSG